MEIRKMVALPMLAITLLAGCAGGETGGGAGTSGGSIDTEADLRGTTVNFMYYSPSDQDDANALTALLAEFTEETGISVRAQATPKDSYDSTFRSAITRGRYKPDLAYLDQPLIATYASTDYLVSLDSYIEDNDVDLTAYNQAALSTNYYNGHYYGLPLNVTASVLFYNKDLVPEASVPTTWEQWKNVSVPSGKALFEGIGTEGYAGWYFQAFLENAGGKLYDEETKRVAFNSPQGIEAATFIRDLYRLDNQTDIDVRSSSNAFINGDILFKIGSSYDIDNIFKQKPNFNLGTVLMPGKTADTHYSCMGGENLVIPTSGTNQAGGLKLLEFLSSKNAMQLLGSFTGNFPAITSYCEAENTHEEVVLEQLTHVVARPIVPGWIRINDEYLGAALDNILNYEQRADIATALATAETQANAVLDSYN